MTQPPLDNQSDFVVEPLLLVDRDAEKLVVMVKSTWELASGASELELAPDKRQRAIRPADIPWGLPEETSPMLPGDLCVRKPGTDVVWVARGYAPGGRAVGHFDVSIRVGAVSKVVRVFGLRVWEAGGTGISSPRPITELDLRYEYAWGGSQFDDTGHGVEEARNPLGRGVVLDNDSLTHQPAPQIENPFELISSILTKPAPAGVGPIPRHWEPRRSYCGTYDARWLDERAPLLPADEDDRVNLMASPELSSKTPLRPGDEVALSGSVPGGGGLRFALPKAAIEIEVRVQGREPAAFRPYLDTVVVDQLHGLEAGSPVVELVWRASVPAPRRMKDAQVIVREVQP